jgi:hypothetical protein
MILYIDRGLPGSGKTTLAAAQTKFLGRYYEADQYFMVNGSYCYEPSRIGVAHAWCQAKVFEAMRKQEPCIVVSNTFSQKWEYGLYLDFAFHFNYEFEITDLFDAGLSNEQLAARCIHRVPVDKIAQMRARWEK